MSAELESRQVAAVAKMKAHAWSLLLVTLIAVTCETQSQPRSVATPPTWLHDSQSVDPHVVQTFPEPEHCGGASTFLVVGWPLGHPEPNLDNARWYVHNPEEFMKRLLLGEFATGVTPPQEAEYTGYHNATFQLWLAPSDQDVEVYMKTSRGFERWPRAKQALLCV